MSINVIKIRHTLALLQIFAISLGIVNAQATLPLSRTTWDAGAPVGWTDNGTAAYTTTFACSGSNMGQLNSTGDSYTVFFSSAPDQLTFKLKDASMSGASSCLVEQSADGVAWTTLGTYGTASGATAITNCADIIHTLNGTTRYVRWSYTKETGNCGLDDVSVTAIPCSDPTSPASSIVFSNVSFTSFDISWTNGNGTNRLVVISTSPITSIPTDGVVYTANTAYGSGSDIGVNEFVVYNGTGSSVSVTGMSENTTYYVTIFEFNSPGNCYLTITPPSGSQTTLTVVPTELRFTATPSICTEEGATFSVTVCATDASGNIAGTYSGNITVSVNTGSGTLGGTTTVAASSGCATFGDLTLSLADSYTLLASDGSITNGISSSFTISSAGTCTTVSSWSGLIINEASNGSSGAKEYYEFVVAGQCGAIVDVRGWMLDDNNGTFTNGFPTTSGIAQGHYRLTNHAQWSAIPVGSLVVIYNADDINPAVPANDPYDGNGDSLYVIPHTNSDLLEYCSSIPYYGGTGDWDSTYSPCSYVTPSAWGGLGMRNTGDAVQVRNPSGVYWHGVSYGDNSISGGPDNLKISTASGSGMVFYFNDGDYKVASNWSSGSAGTAAETPGNPNNAANLAWLRTIRDPLAPSCVIYEPMPILGIRLKIKEDLDNAHLSWTAIMYGEVNGNFHIERSTDGIHFQKIAEAKAHKNTESYKYADNNLRPSKYYYRIVYVSSNERNMKSNTVSAFIKGHANAVLYPNPSNGKFMISVDSEHENNLIIELSDILGRTIKTENYTVKKGSNTIDFTAENVANGTYLLTIKNSDFKQVEKIVIQK